MSFSKFESCTKAVRKSDQIEEERRYDDENDDDNDGSVETVEGNCIGTRRQEEGLSSVWLNCLDNPVICSIVAIDLLLLLSNKMRFFLRFYGQRNNHRLYNVNFLIIKKYFNNGWYFSKENMSENVDRKIIISFIAIQFYLIAIFTEKKSP